MSFDDLKAKWQSHDSGIRLNLDAKFVLNEVRRNHRTLESQLWWRDTNEVLAAFLITCVFIVLAMVMSEWTLLVCAAGSLFVGLYFILDRIRQRRGRVAVEESLRLTIDASIEQVEHQIWLLSNLWKWYLLPLVPGLVLFLFSASFQSHGGIAEQLVIAAVGAICVIAFWLVNRINQREIRRTLEPRRIELEELRASLRAASPEA